jgi:hypothetical protein
LPQILWGTNAMAQSIERKYPDGRYEVHKSQSMAAVVTRSIYMPIAIGTMILGAVFGGLGVLLVYLGATGDTHLKLFGQSMDSASVGVASIFIGAVTVILIIRRLLKSADQVSKPLT